MFYITPYLANSRQFLVTVAGSRDLSSVVYEGLKNKVIIRLRAAADVGPVRGKAMPGDAPESRVT